MFDEIDIFKITKNAILIPNSWFLSHFDMLVYSLYVLLSDLIQNRSAP